MLPTSATLINIKLSFAIDICAYKMLITSQFHLFVWVALCLILDKSTFPIFLADLTKSKSWSSWCFSICVLCVLIWHTGSWQRKWSNYYTLRWVQIWLKDRCIFGKVNCLNPATALQLQMPAWARVWGNQSTLDRVLSLSHFWPKNNQMLLSVSVSFNSCRPVSLRCLWDLVK